MFYTVAVAAVGAVIGVAATGVATRVPPALFELTKNGIAAIPFPWEKETRAFGGILQAKRRGDEEYRREADAGPEDIVFVRYFVEIKPYESEVANLTIHAERVEEGFVVLRAMISHGGANYYSDTIIRPSGGPVRLQPQCDSVVFYAPDDPLPHEIPDTGNFNELFFSGINVATYLERYQTWRGWVLFRTKATASQQMEFVPTCTV